MANKMVMEINGEINTNVDKYSSKIILYFLN